MASYKFVAPKTVHWLRIVIHPWLQNFGYNTHFLCTFCNSTPKWHLEVLHKNGWQDKLACDHCANSWREVHPDIVEFYGKE